MTNQNWWQLTRRLRQPLASILPVPNYQVVIMTRTGCYLAANGILSYAPSGVHFSGIKEAWKFAILAIAPENMVFQIEGGEAKVTFNQENSAWELSLRSPIPTNPWNYRVVESYLNKSKAFESSQEEMLSLVGFHLVSHDVVKDES